MNYWRFHPIIFWFLAFLRIFHLVQYLSLFCLLSSVCAIKLWTARKPSSFRFSIWWVTFFLLWLLLVSDCALTSLSFGKRWQSNWRQPSSQGRLISWPSRSSILSQLRALDLWKSSCSKCTRAQKLHCSSQCGSPGGSSLDDSGQGRPLRVQRELKTSPVLGLD